MDTIIDVKNVSKSFKVYMDKGNQLKERALFWKRNRYEERQVLKDISFQVERGEALGLIGKNGCGKSTTLKLLSKIIYPDSGNIEIKGRVSSLLELGAGFHPDMSGRENIYTNASIYGLTKKEIDERMDDIVAFSELEEFLDNPVRTYSSGMYMRLAFSVAINVDADILLVDEILAVGDSNFQKKCYSRMKELKTEGVTIILVTHSGETISKFCNKAIWINEGEILADGPAKDVVAQYQQYMDDQQMQQLLKEEKRQKLLKKEQDEKFQKEYAVDTSGIPTPDEIRKALAEARIDITQNHFGLEYIQIEDAVIKNGKGEETTVFKNGDSFELEIYYKVNRPLEQYVFGMGFYTQDKEWIFGNNTQIDRIEIPHTKMNGVVKFRIPNLPLLEGTYLLNVSIVNEDGVPLDFYHCYCKIQVVSSDRSIGVCSIPHEWIVE
ncbi:MAG: ABC transporter ATP-binding protein [Lachnospiraceae bacterium]|nr:ABC transporter ATP-binding protein [Lachnospiraceae bacterium]